MVTKNIKVTKRNGTTELIDLDKIHRVLEWASEGLKNISISQVELNSHIQFYDGIKTSDIHETMIKASADLISEETPDYQYLAARLNIFHLRKLAYGKFEAPSLVEHIHKMIKLGKYDKHITEDYTDYEISIIEKYIDHNRDLNFSYAAVKQLEGKYLVQNKKTHTYYESPQMIYILVAMCLFSKYSIIQRLRYVKDFYDATSLFKISLPTPIMAGVRTPTRQFSSCVLIETGDSLDEINSAASAIVKYISLRAGIGINGGMIRALGSEIRGGEAVHTGVIPFWKHFQTAVKSCSQGGVRSGAATLFYPFWHLEVESLLVLKNNRGIESNRIRQMDYGVQLNKLMYTRLIKKQNITLFSPNDVDGLYDAFFTDQELFEKLYIKYENDPTIRKIKIPATELFGMLMQERASTGRIYIQNVDHCNTHSSFIEKLAPIKQSNLCLEITIPTKPLKHIYDKNGEIATCTLSAINLGMIDSLDDLDYLCELTVRSLDALLDYQDYPIIAAENSAKKRRTLGIGIINYANHLAKNKVKYSDGSANVLTHQLMEAFQYYLLKASNKLAQEFGACELFHETKYSQGIMPIDTYKKSLDKVCNTPLLLDWEVLKIDILKHGLRNSTLSALMPSETSSQISNSTNGIEPPRGYISVKASKDGIMKQVVPNFQQLKDDYELLWDMPNNKGYLELVGIMQKFVDQSISANTNYDPSKFENNKVPMTILLKDLLTAYQLGIKTLYYHNTRDGASDTDVIKEEICESGACKI